MTASREEAELDPDPRTGSGIVDLWSLPPTAITLDDPALGEGEDALDRLAAVLPVFGDDFDAALSSDLDPDPDPSALSGTAHHGGAVPRDGTTDPPTNPPTTEVPAAFRTARPSVTRRRRSAAVRWRTAPGRGVPPVGIVMVMLAVYAISVAVTLLSAAAGSEPADGGRSEGRIVVDGPLPCPMYRVPESSRGAVTSSGKCFFVG